MSGPDPGNIGTVPPRYGAQYPLSRATISEIQTALQAVGFYKGGDTGYGAWNPQTKDAVAAFQRMHFLPPTGQFDKATAKALWHLQDCLPGSALNSQGAPCT